MKNFLILTTIGSLLLFTSCTKSNEGTPAVAPVNETFNPSSATLLKQGSFSGSMNYTVTGSVKLYESQGKKYIYFENFNSSNGPDLKVYVATTNSATQFINLGSLKGVTGTQVYQINNPPDFSQYNKVLIWCERFGVLFGTSTIQ